MRCRPNEVMTRLILLTTLITMALSSCGHGAVIVNDSAQAISPYLAA